MAKINETDAEVIVVNREAWDKHCAEYERLKCTETKYWNNICELQRKQTEKGIRTYGQKLEDNTDLDTGDRITYLEEELIDALMYLEHLRASLQ